jgi:hypothetical protein
MPRTSDTGPACFSSRMQFAATNRARLPWRHRTKCKIYQQSSVEKKQLAEKRHKNKADYNDALAAASSVLQEEAAKLKEQFGAHSVQYYMDEIMQSSQLAKKKRSVNCWNVYLRNEVKHLNDGQSYLSQDCHLYLYFTTSTSTRCTSQEGISFLKHDF